MASPQASLWCAPPAITAASLQATSSDVPLTTYFFLLLWSSKVIVSAAAQATTFGIPPVTSSSVPSMTYSDIPPATIPVNITKHFPSNISVNQRPTFQQPSGHFLATIPTIFPTASSTK
jgi:hypothetical protein